eukprot:m.75475 g.75475  ORF g.75475 m.75475 type:complete len:705 (+) comp12502_c0_seq1:419-2533(+)
MRVANGRLEQTGKTSTTVTSGMQKPLMHLDLVFGGNKIKSTMPAACTPWEKVTETQTDTVRVLPIVSVAEAQDEMVRTANPMEDPVCLLLCPNCNRHFIVQTYNAHIELCNGRSPSPDPPGRASDTGRNSDTTSVQKREPTPTSTKASQQEPRLPEFVAKNSGYTASVQVDDEDQPLLVSFKRDDKKDKKKKEKEKKKSKPVTKKSSETKVLDLDRMCGVVSIDGAPACKRALSCKAHSVKLKRAVTGRSNAFDKLLAELVERQGKVKKENQNKGKNKDTRQNVQQAININLHTPRIHESEFNLDMLIHQDVSKAKKKDKVAVSQKRKSELTGTRMQYPQPLAVCSYGARTLSNGGFSWDSDFRLIESVVALTVKSKAARLKGPSHAVPVGEYKDGKNGTASGQEFYFPPLRVPGMLFDTTQSWDFSAPSPLFPGPTLNPIASTPTGAALGPAIPMMKKILPQSRPGSPTNPGNMPPPEKPPTPTESKKTTKRKNQTTTGNKPKKPRARKKTVPPATGPSTQPNLPPSPMNRQSKSATASPVVPSPSTGLPRSVPLSPSSYTTPHSKGSTGSYSGSAGSSKSPRQRRPSKAKGSAEQSNVQQKQGKQQLQQPQLQLSQSQGPSPSHVKHQTAQSSGQVGKQWTPATGMSQQQIMSSRNVGGKTGGTKVSPQLPPGASPSQVACTLAMAAQQRMVMGPGVGARRT